MFFSGLEKFVENVDRNFEVKRLLWNYRRRLQHNIEMDLGEVLCD
jgi:hypothetical protein